MLSKADETIKLLLREIDNKIRNYEEVLQEQREIDWEDYHWAKCTRTWLCLRENSVLNTKDEPEEIEESKEINFEEIGYEIGKLYLDFAKGVERAVNQIRKEREDKQ